MEILKLVPLLLNPETYLMLHDCAHGYIDLHSITQKTAFLKKIMVGTGGNAGNGGKPRLIGTEVGFLKD